MHLETRCVCVIQRCDVMRVSTYLYKADITAIAHFIVSDVIGPHNGVRVSSTNKLRRDTQVAYVRHVLRVYICIETERGRAFISCWMLAQGAKDAMTTIAS